MRPHPRAFPLLRATALLLAAVLLAAVLLAAVLQATTTTAVHALQQSSNASASGPSSASSASSAALTSTAAPTSTASVVGAVERGNLGTNLDAITYYSSGVPFVNLVDQASDWVSNGDSIPWNTGKPLKLRSDGWPASLARGSVATLVLAVGRYPAGTYTVTWSGTGTFVIRGVWFSGTNGSGTVTLDGSTMAILDLRATDPYDPVHGIQVRVPGESQTAVFRSEWLEHLTPYSALRFMDWQRTNVPDELPVNSFTCANRVRADYYSQGTMRGVSVERMVEIANLLNADPWFNIPHLASDDWIRCHARYVAEHLKPGLTARYEFSNESWNTSFRAANDLKKQALSLRLGGGNWVLGLQQRVAQRHIATMAIVSSVFVEYKRPLIRVMSGQAGWSWVLQQRMAYPGVAAATDEVAIAPYIAINGYNTYDPVVAAWLATLDIPTIVSMMAADQSENIDPWVNAHMAIAQQYHKPLVSYEGGQSLVGSPGSDALATLFMAVNHSTDIGAVYRTYLERWKALTGNGLFMHFADAGVYSRWGSWGAIEYPDDPPTSKQLELARFSQGPPIARAGLVAQQVLAGTPVTFFGDASFAPNGTTLSYQWSLPDGSTSSLMNPTLVMTTPGVHQATLTVTDEDGGASTKQVSITVLKNSPPTARAAVTYSSAAAPARLTFSGTASTDPERQQLKYSWSFSDGTVASTPTVTKYVTAATTITATLTVTDPGTYTSQSVVSFTVRANTAPVAVASVKPQASVGSRVVFSSTGTTDLDKQLLTYRWVFSDGTTATSPSFSKVLSKPGILTGTLTVTDVGGLTSVVSVTTNVT